MTLSEWIEDYCEENGIELPEDIPDEETALMFLNTVANGGGGGGSSLPSVTSADEGKVLAVNASGEWAAEQKIFKLIYDEEENQYNLTPEQAFELLRTGVQIVDYGGYIDPEDTTTVFVGRKEYISLYYDAAVYKLSTGVDEIVAGTYTSPFYID